MGLCVADEEHELLQQEEDRHDEHEVHEEGHNVRRGGAALVAGGDARCGRVTSRRVAALRAAAWRAVRVARCACQPPVITGVASKVG